ncbi:SCO family protein [Xanthobacter tagetidis]|jgi:protein SCO1/2|uniref:SCO family protein n=1 Tax=Xanthobacter tagetidis TaxID=60216 RepID=A0A3L7AFC3_9HYPH|nr:SCO family protein [Xanthobacter tagetidis]MBB6306584.1 protein SCO1/2 [Xanthobacter tagetidis]RLP79089.1 SCO family protein [Xanthobacter tagetidis]
MPSPVKPSGKPKPTGAPGRSARLRIVALFSAFLAGAAVLVVAVGLLLPGPTRSTGQGVAAVGGPFTLVDQNGATVTEASLKGKPTLIFFGFTHCPDVCPTALFEMSEIFAALGPDANRLQAFFVSVDPERDTPEVLKSYLGSFAPQLRGLSGTPEQVEAIKKAYRVYSRKVPLTGDDYTMDHTAVVYLMDKTGIFAAPFNAKRPPAEAAAELKRYF